MVGEVQRCGLYALDRLEIAATCSCVPGLAVAAAPAAWKNDCHQGVVARAHGARRVIGMCTRETPRSDRPAAGGANAPSRRRSGAQVVGDRPVNAVNAASPSTVSQSRFDQRGTGASRGRRGRLGRDGVDFRFARDHALSPTRANRATRLRPPDRQGHPRHAVARVWIASITATPRQRTSLGSSMETEAGNLPSHVPQSTRACGWPGAAAPAPLAPRS